MTESAEAWDTLDNDLNAVAAMLPYTPQITKRLREESKAYGDARAREALDTPEGVLAALEGIGRKTTVEFSHEGTLTIWNNGCVGGQGSSYSWMPLVSQSTFGQELTRDEALALIGKQMGGNDA